MHFGSVSACNMTDNNVNCNATISINPFFECGVDQNSKYKNHLLMANELTISLNMRSCTHKLDFDPYSAHPYRVNLLALALTHSHVVDVINEQSNKGSDIKTI